MKKKPLFGAGVALVIIFIGLFLLCAQQKSSVWEGDDLAANDDEFRQELLQMLDLSGDENASAQVDEVTLPDESDQDVLSLLIPEENQATAEKSASEIESAPAVTAENMGLSQDMFSRAMDDVERLESVLEHASSSVDSIRRIIENRNVRIQELELSLQANRTGRSEQQRPVPSAQTGQAASQNTGSGFVARYENARSIFENYNYDAAIEAFQSLLNQNANHDLADNCQYWIGESYFGLKQYQKAIIEFQKVFAYSQTDKHDDAQLMIGLAYVKSGQNERAQNEFQIFLNNYNGSEYTHVAQRYVKNI